MTIQALDQNTVLSQSAPNQDRWYHESQFLKQHTLSMISFKGRHFQKEMILQSIRWYLAYSLSYRDIEEIMKERGTVKLSMIRKYRVE